MSEMIVLDRLTKRFGALTAVDAVTMRVAKGEVLGFLGPNGAGKTTTMRMIAGFFEPTSGSAAVCGFDVVHAPIEVKRRIGYLPEGAPLYGDMRCDAFLEFAASIRGFSGAERRRRIDRVVEMVELGEVLARSIETLSKGFKRRVALAQALLHDPDVLILDEPTDGLDPNQKFHVREMIKAMAPTKAIVVSTHILEEVEAVCTRAAIIARGRLVADGTADSLLARLPHHNHIVVGVPQAEAPQAAALLRTLAAEDVAAAGGDVDGVATFSIAVDAIDGGLPAVAHHLKASGVTIERLYLERGRLDDVFRNLTLGADGEARP
ncbi:MAG: ABC transporter ATP-binding protein [Rhodospirillales bacterium]|nr:ABC transporter ATP-binding protein [Rhodospirillales bacterium]